LIELLARAGARGGMPPLTSTNDSSNFGAKDCEKRCGRHFELFW
jgi:hypothetical protein